ncbi:MAG: CDP-alcohol phosphatidyltransferase family protein [Clostridia bacterium]|nr:CDP-alcohol phosphatidyltransferase family protein [Clostridia bacterium]
MTADIITLSRILFSVLLFVPKPFSIFFTVLYFLCGVTDVLDGFIARKMHTESKHGAILDSAADLVFAFVYAVRILPLLSVPVWIWIWTAIVAIIKIAGIIFASIKSHGLSIEHSIGNKLTGVLLFLLPLSAYAAYVKYGATVVCIAATVTVIGEFINYYREFIKVR